MQKFMVSKDERIEELETLKDEHKKLVAHHEKTKEEINEDKVVQIDNLRKQMLLQIRAVKIKMLNMNEDQLVGTTKLTVIQNAQLTGELDYQSK